MREMVQFSRWDVNRHQDMKKFICEVVKRWGMGVNPIAAGPEIHEVIIPRRDGDGFQERNKYNQPKVYVNIRARFYVPMGTVEWFIAAVVDSGLLRRRLFGKQFSIDIELNRKDTEASLDLVNEHGVVVRDATGKIVRRKPHYVVATAEGKWEPETKDMSHKEALNHMNAIWARERQQQREKKAKIATEARNRREEAKVATALAAVKRSRKNTYEEDEFA